MTRYSTGAFFIRTHTHTGYQNTSVGKKEVVRMKGLPQEKSVLEKERERRKKKDE